MRRSKERRAWGDKTSFLEELASEAEPTAIVGEMIIVYKITKQPFKKNTSQSVCPLNVNRQRDG